MQFVVQPFPVKRIRPDHHITELFQVFLTHGWIPGITNRADALNAFVGHDV